MMHKTGQRSFYGMHSLITQIKKIYELMMHLTDQ